MPVLPVQTCSLNPAVRAVVCLRRCEIPLGVGVSVPFQRLSSLAIVQERPLPPLTIDVLHLNWWEMT